MKSGKSDSSWISSLFREDYKLAKPPPEPYLTGFEALRGHQRRDARCRGSSRGLNSAVAAGIDCVIVIAILRMQMTFHRLAIESEL